MACHAPFYTFGPVFGPCVSAGVQGLEAVGTIGKVMPKKRPFQLARDRKRMKEEVYRWFSRFACTRRSTSRL